MKGIFFLLGFIPLFSCAQVRPDQIKTIQMKVAEMFLYKDTAAEYTKYNFCRNTNLDDNILVCDTIRLVYLSGKDSEIVAPNGFFLARNINIFVDGQKVRSVYRNKKRNEIVIIEGKRDDQGLIWSYTSYFFVDEELIGIKKSGYCTDCDPLTETADYFFKNEHTVRSIKRSFGKTDIINADEDFLHGNSIYRTALKVWKSYNVPIVN